MLETLIAKRKNQILIFTILWVFLWFIPWGKSLYIETNIYFNFILGLVYVTLALILFILPGALLYLLLTEQSDTHYFLGIIPVGFSFSVMLIGAIGLFGRLAGVSFDTVKFFFFLIGLIQLIIFLRKNTLIDITFISQFRQAAASRQVLIFAICLSFFLAFNDLLFFIDDTTYLAYLTNWQHSEQLGFQNIIHEPSVLELERFWLAMYPMGQAILSDLSGIPGILLFSNYLELLLVPLAVLTAYWIARVLGFSVTAASISVLIQVSLYSWMIGRHWPVGTWFYNSIAEDKVSAVFHLAPVFFAYVLKYIQTTSWKNLLLSLFAGIALTLTHPVSLFFTCVMALGFTLLGYVLQKIKLYQFVAILLMCAFLMSPYLVIRLVNFSSQTAFTAGTTSSGGAAFELDRYTNVVSDVFYGLNPQGLLFVDFEAGFLYQAFRYTPVLIAVLALVLSFMNLRKGQKYWYIFSSALLVFLVTIPYSGWIFGYFTDARLIYRASWFSPIGLGAVIILQAIFASSERMQALRRFYSPFRLFSLTFVFVLPILIFMNLSRIPAFFLTLERNSQLAELGAIIDNEAKGQSVSTALDYADTLLLPGISAKTILISFREEKLDNGHNHYLTEAEIEERIYASNAIRSLDTDEMASIERCKYISEFEVQFVIANKEDAGLYMDLVRQCGMTIEKIYQAKDKTLLQIQVSP